MARRPKDHEAAEEFGRFLSELRANDDQPLAGFGRMAKVMFGWGIDVDDETLRLAHKGDVDPHTLSLDVLIGLTFWYSCEDEALGPVAGARLRNAQLVLSARDQHGPSAQEVREFKHTRLSA